MPGEQAAARIRQRQSEGDDPSEATPAVAASLAGRFAAWPEAHRIATDGPVGNVVGEADAVLRRFIAGPA